MAQLLNNKELRSNFLRNLQFVGFYDIGSAWDDLSPFKDQNNLNIEVIEQEGSPFSAVINNFNNPWLQSTGVGMRTMLFGFFSRLDDFVNHKFSTITATASPPPIQIEAIPYFLL